MYSLAGYGSSEGKHLNTKSKGKRAIPRCLSCCAYFRSSVYLVYELLLASYSKGAPYVNFFRCQLGRDPESASVVTQFKNQTFRAFTKRCRTSLPYYIRNAEYFQFKSAGFIKFVRAQKSSAQKLSLLSAK